MINTNNEFSFNGKEISSISLTGIHIAYTHFGIQKGPKIKDGKMDKLLNRPSKIFQIKEQKYKLSVIESEKTYDWKYAVDNKDKKVSVSISIEQIKN